MSICTMGLIRRIGMFVALFTLSYVVAFMFVVAYYDRK